MPHISLWFESGETSLDTRSFKVEEGICRMFDVSVIALSKRTDVDLEALVT